MLKILLRLLCLTFLFISSACQKQEPDKKLQDSVSPAMEKPALIFLVHPYDTPSQLITRFQPLCDYIQQKINHPVKLELASSYVDQIKRISNGQADLAYMGPTPFLRAQDHYLADEKNKLIPIAAEVKGGEASYHSVIVVRNSSVITTVDDLNGRTLALGAPHSFSSHYVPRVLIGNAGLAFKDLRDFAFLGRHERVALAVLHGDFDAGGLNREVAQRYKDRSPGLRILSTSPPLAPHLIVARPELPIKQLNLLKTALLSPEEQGGKYQSAIDNLGSGTRFTRARMKPFELARRIIAAVESTPAALVSW